MPLFDAYLMVDWSAASRPNQGKDSVWWAHAVREGRRIVPCATQNVRTRAEARRGLSAILSDMMREGRRTLVGFDFPLAYPAGFAKALGLTGAPWQSVWSKLAGQIADDWKNANNRFIVAGDLNRKISDSVFPFWGHHPAHAWANVAPRKPSQAGRPFAEHRAVERQVKGPQPCWKLYGNGSVGSQALLGIPVVDALRRQFPDSRAWPFETRAAWRDAIVFAEIYPSLFLRKGIDGHIKDKLQVEVTVSAFAKHDDDGTLRDLLAAPEKQPLTECERAIAEEGWILGVV